MNKKYTFVDTKKIGDVVVRRIKALRDIKVEINNNNFLYPVPTIIKKNQLGGWIESEDNLCTTDESWVSDEACVYNHAVVEDESYVFNNAQVYENGWVHGNSVVCNEAQVYGNAQFQAKSCAFDNARVYDDADVNNTHVSGYAKIYEKACLSSNQSIILVRDCAEVHGNANIFDRVRIFNFADVYDKAVIRNRVHLCGHAKVYGEAQVLDDARILSNASVYDKAIIRDYAIIKGDAQVFGNAEVNNDAKVDESARVYGNAVIGDNIKMFDNSVVCDHGLVGGYTTLHDNAVVCGDVQLRGYSCIGRNGIIKSSNQVIGFIPHGDFSLAITGYIASDKTIMIDCVDFNGDIYKFKNYVKHIYPDKNSIERMRYLTITKAIKRYFKEYNK